MLRPKWVVLIAGSTGSALRIHFSAKAVGGKGSVPRTITSMFYAAGLMPIAYLTHYVDRIYPPAREMLLEVNPDWRAHNANPYALLAIRAVQFAIVAYVVTKLVSVVRFVFSLGTFRALFSVGVAGIVDQLALNFIWTPFLAELVKRVK
jgi:hypothetical protein